MKESFNERKVSWKKGILKKGLTKESFNERKVLLKERFNERKV